MRNPRSVVVTGAERIITVGDQGRAIAHATRDARQWSLLMQRLSEPVLGQSIVDLIASISDLDDDLWQDLLAAGHVLQAAQPETLLSGRDRVFRENPGFRFAPGEPRCEHLIVACTGSVVAGLMAPTLLSLAYSRFQKTLDVMLTTAAQKFVTRELLEAYGIRSWCDAFETREGFHVPHVQLGRSASCILVMPATANALHRIATGACSDLLSLTIAAGNAPVVLAPAMNETMWNHRAVQRNVHQLREDGMYVIEPTLIFGAADVASQGAPMFGGHGTLWGGPGSLMDTLAAVMRDAGRAPAAAAGQA